MINAIYRSSMIYEDGRTFDDIWVEEEGALSYLSHCPAFKGLLQAVLYEYKPDKNGVRYKEEDCILTYDYTGEFYEKGLWYNRDRETVREYFE